MKRVLGALLICLVMLLAAGGSALAAEPQGDRVVFGEDVTIGSDEVVTGSLVVLGGNVDMRGQVNKDLVVFGGGVDVWGRVNGNLAVFGGTITLESSAVIEGNLSAVGGAVDRRPGSTVRGSESGSIRVPGVVVTPVAPPIPPAGIVATPPALPTPPVIVRPQVELRPEIGNRLSLGSAWRPVWEFFRFIAVVVAVMALAVLVTSFFPAQLRLMQETMVARFWPALGVGCLTYVVAVLSTIVVALLTAAVAFVLAISIIGIPLLPFAVGALLLVLVALVLATGVGALYGFIASAKLAGERVLEALGRPATAAVAAVVGVLVLSLVGIIPCVGGLVLLGAVSLGLGAEVLTKLGTQEPLLAPVSAPASPEPPAGPAPEELPPAEPPVVEAQPDDQE